MLNFPQNNSPYEDYLNPNHRFIAHICKNKKIRNYPSMLCSCCSSHDTPKELDLIDLCTLGNLYLFPIKKTNEALLYK